MHPTYLLKDLRVLAITLLSLTTLHSLVLEAHAETVLIANVNADGSLNNNANPFNGIVTSTRFSEGVYGIEFESPGAFAGLTPDNFLPQVTILGAPFNDEIATANVTAVSSDEIQVIIRIADAENSLVLGAPEESDSPFSFVLTQTDPSGRISGGSRYLVATGFVSAVGNLVQSAAVDGVEVSSSRNGLGDYSLTLSKPGAFIGDQLNSYVILLQSVSLAGDLDHSIRGLTSSVISDDEAGFQIGTDDLQDNTNDDFAVPFDSNFSFTIFRIPDTTTSALPDSKLLLLAAKVDENGDLLSASSPESGVTITSSRVVEGGFLVNIEKPGLFSGLTSAAVIVHSQVNHTAISDEVSISYFIVNDDNSGSAGILIRDVEAVGQTAGVAEDRPFNILVYRTDESSRADIRVGRKRSLSRMKGNNIYSPSGAGQKVGVKSKGSRPIRSFFAADNDGNMIDDFLIYGKGRKKHIRTRFFRLSGGRQNITSSARTAGYRLAGIKPDEAIHFGAKTKFKSRSEKQRSQIRVRAASRLAPAGVDTGKIKVKR